MVSVFILLFLIAVIVAIAGVILLVVGIVSSRRVMWVSGAIMLLATVLFAAILLFSAVRSTFNFVNKEIKQSEHAVCEPYTDENSSDDYYSQEVAEDDFKQKGFDWVMKRSVMLCSSYKSVKLYLKTKSFTADCSVSNFNISESGRLIRVEFNNCTSLAYGFLYLKGYNNNNEILFDSRKWMGANSENVYISEFAIGNDIDWCQLAYVTIELIK